MPRPVARSFNPRPPLLASEPANNRIDPAQVTFQSTPAITGERAAISFITPPWRCIVSIHARHYWRASLTIKWASPFLVVFQSTPAITGERARGPQWGHAWDCKFQSTPAITGERAW